MLNLPVSRETYKATRMRCVVSRESFAYAKFRKDDIEQIFYIDASCNSAEGQPSQAEIFCLNIQARRWSAQGKLYVFLSRREVERMSLSCGKRQSTAGVEIRKMPTEEMQELWYTFTRSYRGYNIRVGLWPRCISCIGLRLDSDNRTNIILGEGFPVRLLVRG